jgi:hypothetical protein
MPAACDPSIILLQASIKARSSEESLSIGIVAMISRAASSRSSPRKAAA